MAVGSRRQRTIWVIVVVIIVVAVGVFILLRREHPGGDPGGQVYASLKVIRGAVPADASGVEVVESADAQRLPACSYMPHSHAGWGEALVAVRFTDAASSGSVVAHISSVLERAHWDRHDTLPGVHVGAVPRWFLHVKSDSAAVAFAYPTPVGSHVWFITASWKPPGPVDQGCP